jgi:hypothetical protein
MRSARSVLLLPAVLGGVALAAPAASAAACGPETVPPGATVLARSAQALVWQRGEEVDPDGYAQILVEEGCAIPDGPVRKLNRYDVGSSDGSSDYRGEFAGTAGTFVAHRYAARGGRFFGKILDLRTGADRSLPFTSIAIAADGAAVGATVTDALAFARPGANSQVILSLADATDVRITVGAVGFTVAGRRLRVNTAARPLPGPPRRIDLCKALSRRQAAAAGGGSEPGALTTIPDSYPVASAQPPCSWGRGALTLVRRGPLNASGRRALLASARAAGLRRGGIAGANAFVVTSERTTQLSILKGGNLFLLRSRPGLDAEPVAIARLKIAGRAVLRSFGWRPGR